MTDEHTIVLEVLNVSAKPFVLHDMYELVKWKRSYLQELDIHAVVEFWLTFGIIDQ